MNMKVNTKSLADISWQVEEPEYRADPALSYSTLAKYERSGFGDIEHLGDKIETPSLTFGSAVDSIITGGEKEFHERFVVAEFPSIPDSIIKIVKSLFNQYHGEYCSISDIPDNRIIQETTIQGYQLNWKPETRAKVIKEKGTEYYNLLYIAGGKTILNTETYNDVYNAVNALRQSNSTKFYFAPNNPFECVIRYYQLKFKATLNNVDYRCMADLIVVNYINKTIQPIDLKTSSHTEWDFYKSFIDWNYQIQARLYWRIIKDNTEKDEFFKDFKVLPYKFIVVNKRTLTPLVWDCDFTESTGTLKFGKYNQIELRDPETIGRELSYYLSSRPAVPLGISVNDSNDLREWLNTM